jgi:serine/threonine protein kinase
MLDAVGYVHEQGLVHRDIKPSNFMIDKKGKVKLLDFGIAKNTDASSAEYTQTGTGMQMGTPMYMSPEQITETKSVTAQSDIYSLGVVLWQLVTGEKPYNTNTLSTFQLQLKIVNEPLVFTGSAFDAIIKKATEKDESGRFANCSQFSLSLFDKNENLEKESTLVISTGSLLSNKNDLEITRFEPNLEIDKKVNTPKNEKTKEKVLKFFYGGQFFLVDVKIQIFADDILVGSGSAIKGFNFEIENKNEIPKIVLKIWFQKVTIKLPKLDSNKNYLIEISYDHFWGTFNSKPKSIIVLNE